MQKFIQSPRERIQLPVRRCRHHRGDISHSHCLAGVLFASVQVVAEPVYKLPCLVSEGVTHTCSLFAEVAR